VFRAELCDLDEKLFQEPHTPRSKFVYVQNSTRENGIFFTHINSHVTCDAALVANESCDFDVWSSKYRTNRANGNATHQGQFPTTTFTVNGL
jgi:hypothetical protein